MRKSCHDWNHVSEFVLEFPNLSWNRFGDGDSHGRMKDGERISLPVRKTSTRILLGSNDPPPAEGRFRIFMFLSETCLRRHHQPPDFFPVSPRVWPVSIICRLLLLRLSSFRSLDMTNCRPFRCLMLFPDRSILTMSDGSPEGTWFRSAKKKKNQTRRQNIRRSLCQDHTKKMMTRPKMAASGISFQKRLQKHLGKLRISVGGLRGFQDVVWVAATVNVFKMQRSLTTWTAIFPPPTKVHTLHFFHVWPLRP